MRGQIDLKFPYWGHNLEKLYIYVNTVGAYVNCNISEGLSSADINSYK